jgi:endonuclease/exonuclease/phosphatase family metal-dependent hydrolase
VAIEIEPGVEVQVINTHLGLVPLEQRHQAAALMGREWLGGEGIVDPLILTGDFNATSRYACYKQFVLGLRDAQKVLQRNGTHPRTTRTFPSRFPMLRIDHLFVSPRVEVVDVHANSGPLARAASDHLPLVGDFKVRTDR